ncbi:MAG: L-threonylcarbamoyladenylate synthase [Candidatus Pacearchaeota archaeon]|nr:L-threonylcarbamoyladenylate synthase [Candidatus Pacearchaeota archaeon]
MKTLILKIDKKNPERKKILLAANIIRKGGLVAFPTETVYGLGADALNPKAVKKIYEVKRRPFDNPLIVHIARKKDLFRLARSVPKEVKILIRNFWPGPLTLILKASKIVPKVTTAGLDTIAIRMPNHKVALDLIKACGKPIAAPSANLSGRPSPTLAQHVIQDLYGKIDLILDAGPTDIGVESTVLDLSSPTPQILRPGGITFEKLKKVLKDLVVHPVAIGKKTTILAKSPGLKHKHYAPKAKMIVVEGKNRIKKIKELAMKNIYEGKKIGILAISKQLNTLKKNCIVKFFGKNKSLKLVAKNLFKLLRELDEEKVDLIIAEGVEDTGLGLAIMNRLRKAAGYKIIN